MDSQIYLERYQILSVIGKGSYGVVYKAKDLDDNTLVAIKKLEVKESQEGLSSIIIREIGLLKRLEHPSIVGIKDFFFHFKSFLIVFEYLDQDLHSFIESLESPLSESVIKHYMFQLLQGINYCHNNCIVHRDLKPHNLLISSGTLKIADFGLSKLAVLPESPVTPTVQTLWYRAPELLLGTNYTEKIDIWSIGCIFGELVTGAPIFPGSNQLDQIWTIFKVIGTPDPRTWQGFNGFKGFCAFPQWNSVSFKEIFPVLSEEGVELISKLLVADPRKRITSGQALNLPYFREYNYGRNKYQ